MRTLAALNPLRGLVSLFYPPLCVACLASVEPGEYLCAICEKKAPRIKPPFCAKCSEPFAGAISGSFSCANCAHRELHFEAAVAAYRSRGIVRRLVHEFKYNRQLHLRHPIAQWLCQTIIDPRLHGRHFDLIVPVPLHPARERERGFNQAQLLAEILSAKIATYRCDRRSSAFVTPPRRPPSTAPSACKICITPFVYEKKSPCETCACC